MKKIIIFFIIILLGIIVFLSFKIFGKSTAPSDNQISPVVFPNDNNLNNSDNGKLVIRTSDGNQVSVRNFLVDSRTVEDNFNTGYYYLGNHFPADATAASKNPEYVIEYIKQTGYFNIALLQEPIAQTRLNAEKFLIKYLGLPKDQICLLNYMVSVPYTVNEFYTGTNLGFSFCPGSVKLE